MSSDQTLFFGDDWASEVQRAICDIEMKRERHEKGVARKSRSNLYCLVRLVNQPSVFQLRHGGQTVELS